MLRITPNIGVLRNSVETVNSVFPNVQPVRWRKPRWLPVAKTKMFRVPQRPKIPEDEQRELLRLYNGYRTQIKSLKAYLEAKYSVMNQVSEDPEEQKRIFVEDFARCIKINDEWNAQIKLQREKRVEEELDAQLEFASKRMELEFVKNEKKMEIVEEVVREEIAKSESYITAENIDRAIDAALENEVDYNFAITTTGEKLVGRDTVPPQDAEKDRISLKQ